MVCGDLLDEGWDGTDVAGVEGVMGAVIEGFGRRTVGLILYGRL